MSERQINALVDLLYERMDAIVRRGTSARHWRRLIRRSIETWYEAD